MKFTKITPSSYLNLNNVTGLYIEKRYDVSGERFYAIKADNAVIEEIYGEHPTARKRLADIVADINEEAKFCAKVKGDKEEIL